MRAIYPDEKRAEFYNHGICPKGASGLFNTYNPYRVKKPLKRTNPKKGLDEDPGWVEISWEEAFDTITTRMQKIRADNPDKLIWQHGHGKYLIGDKFPKAFAKAFGTTNLVHRTTTCEAARHVADELTWGYHGFLPDLANTRMMLNFGANYFEAEQFARWLDLAVTDGKDRGLKVVAIEPRLSHAAAKADQWIPIRPGKDVVLLLGMARILIEQGLIDTEFLTTYTNSPNLVGADGHFLRDAEGNSLVWDEVSGAAKPFVEGVKPALRGSYKVKGEGVATAFEVFAKSITEITPQYVEEVADVPAQTVLELATELGRQAMIGATVVVDGKPHRYRPVALHTFRGLSAKQYGTQTWRAGLIVQMLLGCIDAVGGINLHSVYKKPGYFEPSKAEYPPSRVDLQESVFFPHATHNIAQQVALTLLDPAKYGLPYVPEMQIFYATNRPMSTSESETQFRSLTKTYNVAIDIVLSEVAMMADIVLPDLTYLESWHLSPTRYTPSTKHTAIRQPAANAYNIPHDGYSILWELATRLGIRDEYIKQVNKQWYLKKYAMEPGRDYSAKEAVELLWLETTKGKPFEIALKDGFVGQHLSPAKIYQGGVESKFKGAGKPKMNFYAEQLVGSMDKIKNVVKEHRIKIIDLDAYQTALAPLPGKAHAFPEPHLGAKDYPYYLITYKRMFRNQSGNTSTNPILNALGPDITENFILMNTAEAANRGIKDGEVVIIETRVGKVSGKIKATEGIRPDTVAVSYHYGQQSKGLPEYARKGIPINQVLELHPDVVSGMNSFNDTKCRILKSA
jgi:anaerobic selenocysteine-containing dehydrogenase